MNKKQATQIAKTIFTREQTEEAMRLLAIETYKLDAEEAAFNKELASVRTKHEAEITAFKETIELLEAQIRSWADKTPDAFAKKKSVELIHGTCGYRTSPPSIKPIPGVTWEKVTAILDSKRPDFIRTVKQIDKEALLASRSIMKADDYAMLGLRIHQPEEFYIDPKKDLVGKGE